MTQANQTKVLIVDDSETIRRTAEALLKKEGYTVGVAEDGFQAFSAIVDFNPDIIFLDIMMPRLDGYQVCRRIGQCDSIAHVSMILLN